MVLYHDQPDDETAERDREDLLRKHQEMLAIVKSVSEKDNAGGLTHVNSPTGEENDPMDLGEREQTVFSLLCT